MGQTRVLLVGDCAVYVDERRRYYVRHATTDKLLRGPQFRDSANGAEAKHWAIRNSDQRKGH